MRRADLNHLHVPTVLKSGSLNLLEPSRPLQELLYLVVAHRVRILLVVTQLGCGGCGGAVRTFLAKSPRGGKMSIYMEKNILLYL